MMIAKKKILVAVSGGIDSTMAMKLLLDTGYDVAAAHMKLWSYSEVGADRHRDGRCCSLEDINDLHQVCNSLGVPFYVLNFAEQFKTTVIENFVSEYKKGRTPNPCVLCNTHLKWSNFLKKAREIGCDYIATGHYARVEYDSSIKRFLIKKGVDDTRDQSYALWGLSQDALAHTLFPLGEYTKTEIRELAVRHDLKNARKAESREICFVADDDYHRFLKEWEAARGRSFAKGNIIDSNGNILNTHDGIVFYTIGQRKGLGISNPGPLYVTHLDPQTNDVIVGDGEDLLRREFFVTDINWIARENQTIPFEADIKIRYLHTPAPARVEPLDGAAARIIFHYPARAITPGQSAVFYDGDIVIGGGFISLEKN